MPHSAPAHRPSHALGGRAHLPGRWRWPAVVAFWILFGLLYSNLVYLSMMGHGHSWLRLVLWQQCNWLAWAALTPVVLALWRLAPVEPSWHSWRAVLLHVPFSVAVSLVHLVPLALATSRIWPYRPVVEPVTFAEAYRASLGSWFRLDMTVYWAIVAAISAWHVYRRMERREVRASQLEASLSKAELEALKLRLQPHFLFNALHAATGLVRRGDSETAVATLVGLSDLLRYVLEHAHDQEVALREELEFGRRYLDVQQVRFGSRIDLSWSVAPETRGVLVPSLFLQPLLENAVEHGLSGEDGAGRMALEARRDDGFLVVTVENSVTDATGDAPGAGFGVGLATTRARLQELYGGAASLVAEEPGPGRFRAVLRVPWRREADGGRPAGGPT